MEPFGEPSCVKGGNRSQVIVNQLVSGDGGIIYSCSPLIGFVALFIVEVCRVLGVIQECLILLFSTIFTQDSNDIARGQRVDFRFDLVEKSGEVCSSLLPTYVVASALLGSSPSFEYSSRLCGHSFFKESQCTSKRVPPSSSDHPLDIHWTY